ncbi:Organic hydroperoxide resistance transcriptional regulator [Cyclobacterium qasimii M12-11B]|uniref:HTH-type transcriptional regulator SarZ n=1 Tax=Cyclobacterium qasimii M12-11B TaxID=641524 RepID=S7VI27_9BACT|nr:Organic hydroperoxide resistance transcriptional regulator [Cyclobacterium qasimii M12-11B]
MNLTYPQYLVLMVLWESDGISVNQIKEKLLLDTNTLSPLLKRIEGMGLIKRLRSTADERSVIVSLTEEGAKLKIQALPIPEKMLENLSAEGIEIDEIAGLRSMLNTWMKILSKNNNQNESK